MKKEIGNQSSPMRKKRMRCAILSILLVLASLLLIACGGKTEGELTFTLNESQDGYTVSYNLTTYEGEALVIPAEYEGLPVVAIAPRAFELSPNLKSVVFEGVGKLTVGSYAFQDCPALKTVVFQGAEIASLTLEKQAFEGCAALASVTFGEGKIGTLSVGGDAFAGCKALATLSFGVTSLDNLTLEKDAFKNCDALSELFFAGHAKTQINIAAKAFEKNLSLNKLTFNGGTVNWDGGSSSADFFIDVEDLVLNSTTLTTSTWIYFRPVNITVSGATTYTYKDYSKGKNHIASKAVFTDGFTFEGSRVHHVYTTGVLAYVDHYLPYAAEIYLPASVTNIPAGLLGDEGECKVYYGGTAEEWSRVTYDPTGNGNLEAGRVSIYTAENRTYAVQFIGPDGTVLGTVDVEYGSKLIAPTVTVPEGTTLVGWYRDAAYTSPWSFENDTITDNTALYAQLISNAELEKTEVLTHEGFTRAENVFTMQVPYETSEVNLSAAFTVSPHATWVITRDEFGTQPVEGNIALAPGTNTYFLRVTSRNGAKTATYTLRLCREERYTVTYQPDNGEAEVSVLLPVGASVENKQFTRIGYRLNGWYVNGERVNFDTFTVSGNCTLVADWRPLEFTVSFASDTGVAAVPVEYDVLRTLPVPTAPAGRSFNGWADGSGMPFTDATGRMLAPYTLLRDITLYPVWNALTYTITYEGTTGAVNQNPTTYTADSPTITLKALTRAHYTFLGWYKGETPVTTIPAGSKGDLVLTAKWEPVTYTVTYLDTRGADLSALPTSFTIESPTLLLPELSVAHYTFLGWYNENGQRVTSIHSRSCANLTLRAKFSAVSYTVTYENMHGIMPEGPASYTVEDADITLPTPTRAWYSFTGFYTDAALTQRVAVLDTAAAKNITLYAGWELVTYEAHYYVDGVLLTTVYFTYETAPTDPVVPEKAGFTGQWSAYTLVPETLHIHAEYARVQYTITYLGGADSHANPTGYSSETPTIVLLDATKRGYSFLGWYDENGVRVTEIPTGTTGDLTLTARFELATYTITYENVHGTDISAFPSTYTMESAAVVLPMTLTVSGYSFNGWLLDGVLVTEIATGTTGDLVLTASLTPIAYTITYEGAAGHGNPESYHIESETIVLLDATKHGGSFLGWYDENGVRVTEIPTGTTGDLTLTARFELATYTITYENVHGADISAFPSTYTMESAAVVLPTTLTVSGYSFNGWLLDGVLVTEIATGTTGDLVLTASLTPIAYTITYEGATGHGNPESYHIESETIVLLAAVKRGCSFLGWYDENGVPVTEIPTGTTGDLTLTARFELATYTITYENVHGADVSAFPSTYTMESTAVVLPATLTVSGYTFNGWLLNGVRITTIPTGTVGDLVLTADLTPTTYTIVLEPVGGTLSRVEHTVAHGGMLSLPVPTQKGKVFLGWFANTGVDALKYTDASGQALIPYEEHAGRVLYAHWATVQCTVTFDPDGGSTVAAQQFAYGTVFDTSILTYKDGATFDGWFAADGSEYTASTVIQSDVTLYAHWIESTPISTAEEFIAIAQNPAGNYHLIADINLKGITWMPVASFTGKLDGRGHTIKNFMISATSLGGNFGMFYVNSGVIENLTLADFTFNVTVSTSNSNSIGVLVGTNTGTVANCTLQSGSIRVTYALDSTSNYVRVGGLVGTNDNLVTECASFVDLTMSLNSDNNSNYQKWPFCFVGGLVGYNNGKTTYSNAQLSLTVSSLSQGAHYDDNYNYVRLGGLIGCNNGGGDTSGNQGLCYACYTDVTIEFSSSVTSRGYDYAHIGGLVGNNANRARIESCYAHGTITGAAHNASDIGGLVGQNAELAMIVSCYATVDVSVNRTANVGGLVGLNIAMVQNCYATGDVVSTAQVNIGAFVGENSSAGTVFKCYASGDVTAPAGSSYGFFAGKTSGIFNKCYYLRGTSLLINGVYYTHVVEFETVQGLTHGELWSQEFLVEELYWDEEGWIILVNEDPILDWELSIDHRYEVSVVEPTCEEYGYSLYICTDCSRFFVRDFVQPYGHEYGEIHIIAPTCTGEGYIMYTCNRCDDTQHADQQDPLGHDWKHVSHRDPSCTVDGYDLYDCERCDEEKREVIPAAHVPTVSINRKPPSCVKHVGENGSVTHEATDGYTEEIVCAVCTGPDGRPTVLVPSEVIPAHSYVITATTAPTCLNSGYGVYTCEWCEYAKSDVVPATGHSDVNGDVRCDVCGALCGSFDSLNAIHITTVEQLLAIAKNLNGTYILDADLDLTTVTWTPIGTEDAPFTGYFFGNGHKISNLFVTDLTMGGIFGYNSGVIDDLTINGMTVSLLNVNGVVGGVAAHNKGLIINCDLTGNVSVTVRASLLISSCVTSRVSFENIIGGLVGENIDTGTVKQCVSSASITTTFVAESTIDTDGTVWSLMTREYTKTRATVISTAVFGGLVGRNNGKVTDCSVAGTINHTVNAPKAAVTGGEGLLAYKIGFASTTSSVFCGTMVGINAGTVEAYRSTASVSTSKPTWELDPGNTSHEFFGHHAENHFYSDALTGGLLGMNYPYGIVADQ